ncbi:MAG TPA: DUF5677 domain-containing protein [Candidatus Angelobacter sp.]|jgi:hypothetical protein
MELQTPILPGYPDFWPTAFSAHQKFFEAAEKTERPINEIYSVGQTEPLHKVLRHLTKMVCNSFSGLLILGVNGFGFDAMKLARGMFETALIAAYLKQHPEEFDDYMDFHWVTAMKRHRYVVKHTPDLLKTIRPEAIREIEENYARIAPRFKDRNGKVRGRWSKKSFAQIAEDLGVAENYETFYRFASSMHHGDISGLMMQVDPEEGVLDVNIAPSLEWVGEALISGHMAMLVAVSEYVDCCLPEKSGLAKQLEADFMAAWK